MKHGRRPTRAQKKILQQFSFDPSDWLISQNDQEKIVVVCRYTGQHRTIPKSLIESEERRMMNPVDRVIAMGYLIMAMEEIGLDKETQDDLYTAYSGSADVHTTKDAYKAYAGYLITT